MVYTARLGTWLQKKMFFINKKFFEKMFLMNKKFFAKNKGSEKLNEEELAAWRSCS